MSCTHTNTHTQVHLGCVLIMDLLYLPFLIRAIWLTSKQEKVGTITLVALKSCTAMLVLFQGHFFVLKLDNDLCFFMYMFCLDAITTTIVIVFGKIAHHLMQSVVIDNVHGDKGLLFYAFEWMGHFCFLTLVVCLCSVYYFDSYLPLAVFFSELAIFILVIELSFFFSIPTLRAMILNSSDGENDATSRIFLSLRRKLIMFLLVTAPMVFLAIALQAYTAYRFISNPQSANYNPNISLLFMVLDMVAIVLTQGWGYVRENNESELAAAPSGPSESHQAGKLLSVEGRSSYERGGRSGSNDGISYGVRENSVMDYDDTLDVLHGFESSDDELIEVAYSRLD
jgi:hypothetical protein